MEVSMAGEPYLPEVISRGEFTKVTAVEPPPWEETYVEDPTHIIKGYINIQRNSKGGIYTGGDIHETVELAKHYASKATITQVYLAFEVK
jgi:hypothetical protein